MRRSLFIALVFAFGLAESAAHAGAPVILRPQGAASLTSRAAMLATGAKRSRKTDAQVFATDEMRVRIPHGIAGKEVHVTQGLDSNTKPATSLFQVMHSVEAAHSGHAAAVHVDLDDATREMYGEAFLSTMFGALDAASLTFTGADGVRRAATLPTEAAAGRGVGFSAVDAPLAVWTGSSHPELGAALAKKLRVEEVKAQRKEGRLVDSPVPGDAKGKRIVLVQTKRMGDSERFHMDLIEMLHAAYQAKRAGAASVMVVSPYLPYSRSDRMDTPGTTVGAAILPQLMKRAGVDNVVFYSVHQAQEVGIFQALHMKVAHASGENVLAERVGAHLAKSEVEPEALKVLAPDAGAAKRARVFATQLEKRLGRPAKSIDVVVANKERDGNTIKMRFEGDVKGATVVAIDDETASGSTMADVAAAAKSNGAKSVLGAVSHLTGAAHKKLTGSAVDRLFVLDTLPQGEIQATKDHPIEVIPIADHLAKVVKGLSTGKDVDDLLFFEH